MSEVEVASSLIWELKRGKEFVQGCGKSKSRAAGEWNEKAVEWQSK